MQVIELRTDDGVAISACRYEPPAAPRAAVLIGGAMGVKQDFYAPFAQWLAA